MNPKLKAVSEVVAKVDQLSARKRELESEQKLLQLTKIPKLTRLVADGDAKSVNDLSIATARSGYGIPQALAALQTEFDTAVHELRQTLIPISPLVARAYGLARTRMEGIAIEFLEAHISNSDHGNHRHEIEDLTKRIVEISDSVKPLDYLNVRFSAPINQQRLGAESALCRARDVVKNLSHLE